jgi:hypothetical protein
MVIDGNEKEKRAMEAFHQGDRERGDRLQSEFVAELREHIKTQEHCPCEKSCDYHGECLACVAIHRAHRDHMPVCLHAMVNERITALSALTEHTAAR